MAQHGAPERIFLSRSERQVIRHALLFFFCFYSLSRSGQEAINTYPVIYAGFTPDDGDLVGVYAVRTDT